MTKKIEKNLQLKKNLIFLSKIVLYLSLGHHKGLPSFREAFSPQKKTSSTLKHEIS